MIAWHPKKESRNLQRKNGLSNWNGFNNRRPNTANLNLNPEVFPTNQTSEVNKLVRTPGYHSKKLFITYASQDRNRVLPMAEALKEAGLSVWIDSDSIRQNYGPEIVRAIKACDLVLVMCSDASMRSRNVKQEIQIAWKYERPYLPLLLEPTHFPEQLEYWLEGWQWIEVMHKQPSDWIPSLMDVIRFLDTIGQGAANEAKFWPGVGEPRPVRPIHPDAGFRSLLALAALSDQIWLVPEERSNSAMSCPVMRDLGAPQESVEHRYRLGSRIRLILESDREGHLLLLDQGTSGKIYCLCPSHFAPDTFLPRGRTILPQTQSKYDSFAVTGNSGREHLLAIVTNEPLELEYMPSDPKIPARMLTADDMDALLSRLKLMEGGPLVRFGHVFRSGCLKAAEPMDNVGGPMRQRNRRDGQASRRASRKSAFALRPGAGRRQHMAQGRQPSRRSRIRALDRRGRYRHGPFGHGTGGTFGMRDRTRGCADR